LANNFASYQELTTVPCGDYSSSEDVQLFSVVVFTCASSQTELTTSKTRKAMRWNGVNRSKKCWSIIMATMWLTLRGQLASHDQRPSPPCSVPSALWWFMCTEMLVVQICCTYVRTYFV